MGDYSRMIVQKNEVKDSFPYKYTTKNKHENHEQKEKLEQSIGTETVPETIAFKNIWNVIKKEKQVKFILSVTLTSY